MYSSSKVKPGEFQTGPRRVCAAGGPIPAKKEKWNTTMQESEVIFRQGEFISGTIRVLDCICKSRQLF